MVSEIDVRGTDTGTARDRIRTVLAEGDDETAVTVLADHDPEPALYQYEIEQKKVLTWSTETDGPEWELRVRKTGEEVTDLVAFDVRSIPPQRRHEVLTETFARLDPGSGFVLVNDHDPKPLYHELRSTHGEVIDWEYRTEGASEWRVAIQKTGDAAESEDAIAAAFDVREIPKPERHPTIHHRYSNLAEGETMELIAPHEPRPLRREFDQQYGDTFEWQVVANQPGECRVLITKDAEATADDVSSEPDGSDAVHAAGGCGHDHGHHHQHANGNGAGSGPSAGDTSELERIQELDVREYPPAKRHELIFEAYDDLDRGESFVLVNDHDPKPLYHQFDAESGPEFRWEYQQREPGEFRVAVGKADGDEPPAGGDQHSTDFDAPF